MPQRDVLATLTDGYRVARMTADDLPDVIALLADDELGAGREDMSDPAYEDAFARLAADPAHLLVVVLPPAGSGEPRPEEPFETDEDGNYFFYSSDPDRTVLATAQLSVLPGLSRRGATRAQIEGVRVSAVARSIGLGTGLITWAVEHARASGADLVQLTTDASRTRAQQFYARLGFVPSHVGMKLDLR